MGKGKYTIEFVREQFNNKGYILISTEYVNYDTHLEYVCKKHSDFGIQKISLNKLVHGHGCKYCGYEKVSQARQKNIVGKRYGNLVVTEMLRHYRKHFTYCRCKCDCGNDAILPLTNITAGNTRSCGCLGISSRYKTDHSQNLLNKQYGDLRVIKRTDKKSDNGSIIWLCKCVCGNKIEASTGELNSGRKISCGCNYINPLIKTIEVGTRFGILTVLGLSDEIKGKTRSWKCLCDCGNIFYARGSELRSGNSTSCGC